MTQTWEFPNWKGCPVVVAPFSARDFYRISLRHFTFNRHPKLHYTRYNCDINSHKNKSFDENTFQSRDVSFVLLLLYTPLSPFSFLLVLPLRLSPAAEFNEQGTRKNVKEENGSGDDKRSITINLRSKCIDDNRTTRAITRARSTCDALAVSRVNLPSHKQHLFSSRSSVQWPIRTSRQRKSVGQWWCC